MISRTMVSKLVESETSVLTQLIAHHDPCVSNLEVKYWSMISLNTTMRKFMGPLARNDLNIDVIASMCVAIANTRSTVLSFVSPKIRLKLQ